jgi:hypothetical protein
MTKIWTLKQKDIRRLKTTEIKFMRCTAGYSLLYRKRNEDILDDLKLEPVEKKLAQCGQKYLNRVNMTTPGLQIYRKMKIWTIIKQITRRILS